MLAGMLTAAFVLLLTAFLIGLKLGYDSGHAAGETDRDAAPYLG